MVAAVELSQTRPGKIVNGKMPKTKKTLGSRPSALCSLLGFTLVELLVVMTIIAILSGLALVSYQGARRSARDGKRRADLEEVRSALEMRRADCGSYPDVDLSSGDDIAGENPVCDPSVIYITIPEDPFSLNRNYAYSSSDGLSYTLCAALEKIGSSVSGCGSCGETCNYQVSNP